MDGEVLVDGGGVGDVVGGGGFLLGDECIAAEGVSVHVSGEHYSFWWGRT